MSWTKRQLVEEAFGELALAGYVFDLDPEELQWALRRLDTMWGVWEGRGLREGYVFPGSNPADSDLDTESGLPDYAIEPTYLNLAIRLAAGKGKQLSQDTRKLAREGFDSLMRKSTKPLETPLRHGLPAGAGSRYRQVFRPFLPATAVDPLASDGLDFETT